METTVYVRMSKDRVRSIIRNVPNRAKQVSAVAAAAAKAVSKRVTTAFLEKSRGGTDECGYRWKPLSRITELKKLRKKRPTGEARRPSAVLTPGQRDQWWAYYRRALSRHHDKSVAARIAWGQIKRSLGGMLLFEKHFMMLNEGILQDTGQLLQSLTIGAPLNIMREASGSCEYGTERVGAAAHHYGAGVPLRRLWPPPSDWTSAWWDDVLTAARDEVVKLIIEGLK